MKMMISAWTIAMRSMLTPACDLHLPPARLERPEQEAGEEDADGVRASEQRDRDGVEADAARRSPA